MNNINEEKKKRRVSLGYASQAGARRDKASEAEFLMEESAEEICGDTAMSCQLPDGSRAVILSDGMGCGRMAAAESRAAAGMLRRLLKQGVPSARAIKDVNRYLLKKSDRNNEKESFATVDLAIIGQTTGRAKFYKMGAAPSYIIRGRRIQKIQQPALPVGILPEIRLTHVSARLSAGDIIVMMSDGICDSGWRCQGGADADADNHGDDWVISFLNDMMWGKPGSSDGSRVAQSSGSRVAQPSGSRSAQPSGSRPAMGPRQLASALLEEAHRRYGDTETDDATVVIIMIR